MLPTGRKNQLLIQAINGVHQARQAEDTAFKRFSGKDFASDDLKREDALEDKYMSTALGILNGLLYLPETEPIYRKAQQARQVFLFKKRSQISSIYNHLYRKNGSFLLITARTCQRLVT